MTVTPSLLKISVELDQQINLKQFCVQTVLLSFEAEFDSSYHMLHKWQGRFMAVKSSVQNDKKKNGNQLLFQFLGRSAMQKV